MWSHRSLYYGIGMWMLVIVFAMELGGSNLALGSGKAAIKLGVDMPLTGPLARHGRGELRGIKLAVKHFVHRTGLKIDVLVEDNESNAQKAFGYVEKLCGKKKVNAISGGYGSHIIGPASEVSERYKTPYITSGGVASKLVKRGFKYFFRISNLPGYTKAQVGLIDEVFTGAKNIGILYNAKPATAGTAKLARKMMQAKGLKVVAFEMITSGTSDFKPVLMKMAQAGANILVVEGYFTDYVGTIRAAKTLDLPFKAYVGVWGIGAKEFIKELRDLSNYVYGTAAWLPGASPPEAKEDRVLFEKDYQAQYKDTPDYLSMLGYVQTRVLLSAMKKVLDQGELLSGDAIRRELLKTDTITPIGRVAFTENGDAKYYMLNMFQIQEGKWVVVYPPNMATGRVIYPAVPWRP